MASASIAINVTHATDGNRLITTRSFMLSRTNAISRVYNRPCASNAYFVMRAASHFFCSPAHIALFCLAKANGINTACPCTCRSLIPFPFAQFLCLLKSNLIFAPRKHKSNVII